MTLFLVIGLIFFCFIFSIFPVLRCLCLHPVAVLFNGFKDSYFYFKHKKSNNAPFGSIVSYIANNSTSFGCGKTLSSTHFLVSLYKKFDGLQVWDSRRGKFVTQRIHILSNVDFLTIPYERLVSLGQFVKLTDDITAYDDEHDTFTVIYVLIDEASSQLNSRSFKSNFDPVFISRLLTSRHVHASFILTSQRSGMVDALMRQCTLLYIGCSKTWRFQSLSYYDAYEVENASNPSLIKPIRRKCWFVRDNDFASYDTYACVDNLKKSCESGDMLTEAEILALQVNQDNVNMDGVSKPSRRWQKSRKQKK